jgi:hypothetical protein
MEIRCPRCDRKLMTLTYKAMRDRLVIETVCPRCPKSSTGKPPKVEITFPHPLTGSEVLPFIAMV